LVHWALLSCGRCLTSRAEVTNGLGVPGLVILLSEQLDQVTFSVVSWLHPRNPSCIIHQQTEGVLSALRKSC
jgi:hypothetical protein